MFVQHYLTNMFGAQRHAFLNHEMDNDDGEGDTMGMTPDMSKEPKAIPGDGCRQRTVGEASRLAHYLGGDSPPPTDDHEKLAGAIEEVA